MNQEQQKHETQTQTPKTQAHTELTTSDNFHLLSFQFMLFCYFCPLIAMQTTCMSVVLYFIVLIGYNDKTKILCTMLNSFF